MNDADYQFLREYRREAEDSMRREIWDNFQRDRDRNPEKYKTEEERRHEEAVMNAEPDCKPDNEEEGE